VAFPSVGRCTTQDGLIALQNHDFATALRLLAEAGNGGDTRADVLLGQLLLNGQAGIQDPKQAAAWYGRGAKANPQGDPNVAIAQANLASLYVTGNGVPKDVNEGMRLYELSAINGFPDGAATLVGAYTRGGDIKIDNVQALKWAFVMTAQGDARGPAVVNQLRQRVTASEAAQAKAAAQKQFPNLTFAEPSSGAPIPLQMSVQQGMMKEPVSPSAGYTPQFDALHRQPTENNAAVIAQIKSQMKTLPPPYLYELARRVFPDDNQEGVTWFWLARMRATYDAERCTDQTAGQGIQQWNAITDNVVAFIKDHPEASRRGKRQALDREASLPPDNSPEWICVNGIQAAFAGMQGKKLENWLKPATEWPGIRQKIRDGYENAIHG